MICAEAKLAAAINVRAMIKIRVIEERAPDLRVGCILS
jgi:hypothetical protein